MNVKSLRNLVILAAVLGALLSLALWDDMKRRPKEEQSEKAEKSLFSLEQTSLETIRIVDGAKNFLFRCHTKEGSLAQCRASDNSDWEIQEPAPFPGDKVNISSLVRDLDKLESSETIKPEAGKDTQAFLKEFGLDQVSRSTAGAKRIEITFVGGKVRTGYFGHAHPFGGKVYVLTAEGGQAKEDRVMIVADSIGNAIDRPLEYWRDKAITNFLAHDVSAFELRSAKGKISGTKQEGLWMVRDDRGRELPADALAVDSVINSAAQLKAKEIKSDNKKNAASQKLLAGTTAGPSLSLTIQKNGADGKPQTVKLSIDFRMKKDALFITASDRDPLFEGFDYVKETFNKSFSDVRLSQLLSTTERYGFTKIKFGGTALGKDAPDLKQVDGKWVSVTDEKKEIPLARINAILDLLQGKSVRDVLLADHKPGAKDPTLEIMLGDDLNAGKRSLLFWRQGAHQSARGMAKDLGAKRPITYVVDKKVVDQLPWKLADFTAPVPPPAAPPGGKKAGGESIPGMPPDFTDHSDGTDSGA